MDSVQLHNNSIVFDAHCDFLFSAVQHDRRFGERSTAGHMDLPRLQEGGVTAQIFALFCINSLLPLESRPVVESLRQVDTFYQMLEFNADRFMPATSVSDIETAKTQNKVAGILSLEGAEPLAGNLGSLRVFHRLGVRNIGLTWNYPNRAADGVGASHPRGLTDFGRELVAEAQRLGIMIDISHLAAPGVEEVLGMARGPIIASHSNASTVCAHPRNLSDTQLDALAATGGVVCVTFVPEFISRTPSEACLERLLDHVEYISRLIGVDHVGLGSDFDGYDEITQGLEDVSRLPALTAGLVARGFDEHSIRKILGLNLLRVFREVVG